MHHGGTQGSWALSHWRHSRGSWTAICQVCFEVYSSNVHGVGLDGLVGPFQLYYSMILPRELVGSPTPKVFKRQLDSHLSGRL